MRELRRLTEDDLIAAQAVRSAAFGQPADREAAYARMRPLLPHTIGAFENGRLVSVATVAPFEVHLGGTPRPFGALAGVATAPEARRRGHVAALMNAWFNDLHDAGVGFAGEYPFDHAYYARFGFQTVPHGRRLEVPIARFKQQLEIAGLGRLRADAEQVDHFDPRVAAVHEAFAPTFDLTLKRKREPPRDTWATAMTPTWDPNDRYTYLLEGGYVSLKLGSGDTLEVRDFGYLNPEARWGIVAFIAALEGNFDKARLFLPPGDPLVNEWQAHFGVRTNVYQLRIVDLARALEPFVPEAAGELRLALRDPDCRWNDGIFDIAFSQHGCLVKRAPAGSVTADVSLGQRALLTLLWGAVPVRTLVATGMAEGDPKALAALAGLRGGRTAFYPEADGY